MTIVRPSVSLSEVSRICYTSGIGTICLLLDPGRIYSVLFQQLKNKKLLRKLRKKRIVRDLWQIG